MPQSIEPARPLQPSSGTVLETDDDIRQAQRSGLVPGQPPVAPTGTTGPVAASGHAASLFRPTARPPIAMLTVFDDGRMDGEVIRIRSPRFVIGRTEGDLRIPIDARMSSRHIEITLQTVGGLHRWVVTDLQSTHGMFVRVHRTPLTDKAEILVGNGRYRFDAGQTDANATSAYVAGALATGATQGWDEGANSFRPPALTELLGNEIGNRLVLAKPEYWIGTDPTCSVCRPDDPFCEPRHVRLYRDRKGGWLAEHHKTQNGLWLRMPQITVEATVHFQAGEQRFQIKIRQ